MKIIFAKIARFIYKNTKFFHIFYFKKMAGVLPAGWWTQVMRPALKL